MCKFLERAKNKSLKILQKNYFKNRKKLNAKDKYLCYFYKQSGTFEIIWPHILIIGIAENMERRSAEHLWSNYNPLVIGVKSNCLQ